MNSLILGQFGELVEQHKDRDEWKTAILRSFYIPFQICSCYFVLVVVFLRVRIIQKPLEFEALVTKPLKIACSMVWIVSVLLNMMPIMTSVPSIRKSNVNDYRTDLVFSYLIVLHVGVTVPLTITILYKVYLSIILKKIDQTKQKTNRESFMRDETSTLTRKERNYNASYQKLTNRLVIWLFICKVPYIAWYHWSLNLYINNKGISWNGVEGVIKFS